jgi:hypothetical protein
LYAGGELNDEGKQELVSFAHMAREAAKIRPDFRNLTAKQYRKLVATGFSAAVSERQSEDIREIAADFLADPEGPSFSIRPSND